MSTIATKAKIIAHILDEIRKDNKLDFKEIEANKNAFTNIFLDADV